MLAVPLLSTLRPRLERKHLVLLVLHAWDQHREPEEVVDLVGDNREVGARFSAMAFSSAENNTFPQGEARKAQKRPREAPCASPGGGKPRFTVAPTWQKAKLYPALRP